MDYFKSLHNYSAATSRCESVERSSEAVRLISSGGPFEAEAETRAPGEMAMKPLSDSISGTPHVNGRNEDSRPAFRYTAMDGNLSPRRKDFGLRCVIPTSLKRPHPFVNYSMTSGKSQLV